MNINNLKNAEMFVSVSEVGEYRNSIGAIGVLFVTGVIVALFFVRLNVTTVVISIITFTMTIVWCALLVKKDLKRILLFEWLQGMMITLSILNICINLIYESKAFIVIAILIGTSFSVSACISVLLYKKRIKTNYYHDNHQNAMDIVMIPLIGVTSAVIGKVASEAVNYNDMLIILLITACAGLCGFKETELLIRYILVRKYNLESAIRIKSVNERRL